MGNLYGGLPGAMNGLFGASAQQHHMQRMNQGGNLFGNHGGMIHQQQMQQMNAVPVATATAAIPVVQTAMEESKDPPTKPKNECCAQCDDNCCYSMCCACIFNFCCV